MSEALSIYPYPVDQDGAPNYPKEIKTMISEFQDFANGFVAALPDNSRDYRTIIARQVDHVMALFRQPIDPREQGTFILDSLAIDVPLADILISKMQVSRNADHEHQVSISDSYQALISYHKTPIVGIILRSMAVTEYVNDKQVLHPLYYRLQRWSPGSFEKYKRGEYPQTIISYSP